MDPKLPPAPEPSDVEGGEIDTDTPPAPDSIDTPGGMAGEGGIGGGGALGFGEGGREGGMIGEG